MAGRLIAGGAGAAMLAAVLAGPAAAQSGRYGAVADVPLGATGGGWTGQGWTGPEGRPVRDLRQEEGEPADLYARTPRPEPAEQAEVPRPERIAPMSRAPDRQVSDWRVDGAARSESLAEAGPPPYRGRYVRPQPGWALPSYFTAPPFTVRDPARWGLGTPGVGRRWVRYYDDAVLVGPDGRADDVRSGIDWRRDGGRGVGPDWSDDRVTYAGRRAGYAPGTVVTTFTPGTVTTTTTVTEEFVPVRRARRPVRRGPTKTWRSTRRSG